MRIKFTIFLYLFPLFAMADTTEYYYWVTFRDKVGSENYLRQPDVFLSKRSILKKYAAGAGITMDDVPVSNNYIKQLDLKGLSVPFTSRWLNAAFVITKDTKIIKDVSKLDFVTSVVPLGYKVLGVSSPAESEESGTMEEKSIPVKTEPMPKNKYGAAQDQITQIKIDALHRKGFIGQDVQIAILDAGFYKANKMQLFDSLFLQGRIIKTFDFVDHEADVYDDDDHGMQVLSCIASNREGVMIGSAPGANYLLFRTEDANVEMPYEEAYWIRAAEQADALGVDVITSSLGYNTFDDERYNHKISDLDGKTTLISRAAEIAAKRGILVVSSAGNEGDNSWKKLTVPADSEHVIAVGAVDKDGDVAGFSSRGPAADGRIKPDVAALGKRTAVASASGYIVKSNGTSYSAPIMAGALATAMQYNGMTAAEVRNTLLSGTLPDTITGYGIPDFSSSQWKPVKPNIKSHEATDPRFSNWVTADTLYLPFVIGTKYSPEKQWTYKLSCDCGKVWQNAPLEKITGNWYGTIIAPPVTGLHFLEVTDGKTVFKESFYYYKP
ncbi:MAG: hypothetical protein FJ347_00510 [Sphingomonadales bacterium]|nr:hypothetical protein [Sphingomonadales bacterium]